MIWAVHLTFQRAYLQKGPCQPINHDFQKNTI
jgi:hypothetical protein